jgi:hypothetical protein
MATTIIVITVYLMVANPLRLRPHKGLVAHRLPDGPITLDFPLVQEFFRRLLVLDH